VGTSQERPAYNPRSADVGDICRLWATIQECVPGPMSIRIQPGDPNAQKDCLFLTVEESQLAPDNRTPVQHVWAQKLYYNNGYSISWGQLFDLLIITYGRVTGSVRE